jgi:hypothetical protein
MCISGCLAELLSISGCLIEPRRSSLMNYLMNYLMNGQAVRMSLTQALASLPISEAVEALLLPVLAFGRDEVKDVLAGWSPQGHYYHIWTYNPRFYSLGERRPRRVVPAGTLLPYMDV